MDGERIRVLREGQVYIEYGPVAMQVTAFCKREPLTKLCCEAAGVIRRTLGEVAAAMPVLRKRPGEIDPAVLEGLPFKMYQAVQRTGEPTLTPMAAVAGTISDAVADWLAARGATIAVANNGGDIALRLAPGESVGLRTVISLRSGEMSEPVTIRGEDGIGGICTSGLGGRSFTRGVVDSVSVFAARAGWADALATHLANTSFIESERVAVTLAKNIDANTDIPDLTVVTAVDILRPEERDLAVSRLLQEAKRQHDLGNFIRLSGYIQKQHFEYG